MSKLQPFSAHTSQNTVDAVVTCKSKLTQSRPGETQGLTQASLASYIILQERPEIIPISPCPMTPAQAWIVPPWIVPP